METKVCTKCGEEKPLTEENFRLIKNKFKSNCRACENKIAKEYRKGNKEKIEQWFSKNKDKVKEYSKKYREENKEKVNEASLTWYKNNYEKIREYREENKEALRQREIKYAQANKEKIREVKKIYYQNNKNKISKQQAEYRKINNIKKKPLSWKERKSYYIANQEKFKIYRQTRKAKIKQLPCEINYEIWIEIKEAFDNECAYCGKGGNLEQEHFIPISKGGEYTKNNIIPACKSCNCSKRDKDFFEWYPEQPFYSKKRERKILKYLNYDPKTQIQQLALTI